MVRMHAGGAPQNARMGGGERRRRPRTGQIRAGHHLPCHARLHCPGDHLVEVGGEAVVGQIRSDVDEFVAQEPSPRCAIFARMCKVAILLFMALAFAAVPGRTQEGGDLQAQIVYAFHVEDTNLLVNLVQTLATQANSGGADQALRYHLAHAQYRLGLLVGETRPKEAAAAFGDCVDQLKRVLDQDPTSAEALALQSACYDGAGQIQEPGGGAAAVTRDRAHRRGLEGCAAQSTGPVSGRHGRIRPLQARLRGESASLHRSSSSPCNYSISHPPPASRRRAGDTRRPTSSSEFNCNRGAIYWARATRSRRP